MLARRHRKLREGRPGQRLELLAEQALRPLLPVGQRDLAELGEHAATICPGVAIAIPDFYGFTATPEPASTAPMRARKSPRRSNSLRNESALSAGSETSRPPAVCAS